MLTLGLVYTCMYTSNNIGLYCSL